MTTPCTRSLVSFAVALTLTLSTGGCASAPSRMAVEGSVLSNDVPVAIRFDNDAREHVHVYLVGELREWMLGRVAPGARTTLRIPEEALTEGAGRMRLAVVAGSRMTLRAASDARAAITLAQPSGEILSQRWMFSQTMAKGQLTALRLWSSDASVR